MQHKTLTQIEIGYEPFFETFEKVMLDIDTRQMKLEVQQE